MKRVLLIVSGIAALLIIAAFSVPFFIPKSVYKNQIENAATNALQRDVTLAGDVKISVFPRISASVASRLRRCGIGGRSASVSGAGFGAPTSRTSCAGFRRSR